MEVIFLVIIAGVGGWLLYNHYNRKSAVEAKPEAPYKVETPEQPSWHTAPAENIKPVTLTDVLDVNKDGKVDMADVKAAVTKTKTRVKKSADVDGDGKVTVNDAKAAVAKGRRPRSKKA